MEKHIPDLPATAERDGGASRWTTDNRSRLRLSVLAALFAALTAAGAFIRIPAPIAPITLQTFFMALAGLLLGARYGAVSQLIYVLLGLMGLPIFTQGGGPGYLLLPSCGFLLSYPAAAWVTGRVAGRGDSLRRLAAAVLCGYGVVYLIGVPYMYGILNFYLDRGMSAGTVLKLGMLLYVPGDLLKVVLVSILAKRILPTLRKQGLSPGAAASGPSPKADK